MSAVWDIRGPWKIRQAPATTVSVNLLQANKGPGVFPINGDVTGSATSVTVGGPSLTSNSITGSIIDNQFCMQIVWTNNTVGEYNGMFGISDLFPPPSVEGFVQKVRLWGVAWDITNVQDVAAWVSDKQFTAPIVSGP
jgi:hypothetical protein